MIITCPNCNKQFKIENTLIPDEGRDLQCGSCNHVWFYKIEEENSKILKLKEEIDRNDIDAKIDKKNEEIIETKKTQTNIKTEIDNQKKEKKSEKQKKIIASNKDTENKGSKFFSYLIVFIISCVALIILVDTLKNPLINVFPELEIILFNLFETLQDIKLFIIDLI